MDQFIVLEVSISSGLHENRFVLSCVLFPHYKIYLFLDPIIPVITQWFPLHDDLYIWRRKD